MKGIIAILAALLLALAGCGQAEKETEKKESSTPVQSREEATQGTAEEDQAYGQRYLEPVLAGRLLWCDFGPGEMEQLAGTPMIYAFEDLTGGERMRGYWEKYQGAFPREVMEDCLTAYFQVTPEELRDSLLAQYYRPEEEVYFYEGGRGAARWRWKSPPAAAEGTPWNWITASSPPGWTGATWSPALPVPSPSWRRGRAPGSTWRTAAGRWRRRVEYPAGRW